MGTVDHGCNLALRKLGNPTGFVWFQWEHLRDVDDTVKLTGCVSSGVYTKGPRKGRPKFDGTPVSVYVNSAERMAERRRYEAETGKCGECGGDGQMFAGWHHITGTRWRTCVKCNGTGLPQSSDARFTPVDQGKAIGSATDSSLVPPQGTR